MPCATDRDDPRRARRSRLAARMSRKGNCYDNAAMESFWSSFKRESIHGIHPT